MADSVDAKIAAGAESIFAAVAESIFDVDWEPTAVAWIGEKHGATMQVCLNRGSDMVHHVTLVFAFSDGSVLPFAVLHPRKFVAQIIKASIDAEAENRRLEQPVDLSSVHQRSRATTPHRGQPAPLKKSRGGRRG